MERSFRNNDFKRGKVPNFGNSLKMLNLRESVALDSRFDYGRMKLIQCEPDRKGKLSVKYHSRRKAGVIAIDFQRAAYLIQSLPDFFRNLVRSTPSVYANEITILCTSSILRRKNEDYYHFFFTYNRKEGTVAFGTIGTEYYGALSNVYQLVYEEASMVKNPAVMQNVA